MTGVAGLDRSSTSSTSRSVIPRCCGDLPDLRALTPPPPDRCSWTDQRKTAFRIMRLEEMLRRLRQDDLERRSHMRFPEMPGEGASVAAAEHDVDVQGGLAIGRQCNIANQRGDLDLLADRDRLVRLRLPI